MVRTIRPHGPSEVTSAGAGASFEDAAAPIGTPRWPDLLAGLSIAGLLLPEAVAYSGLATLPPQAGVIALFAGLIAYGLIGRSRFAIVSATSSSAAVLASAMLALAPSGALQRAAVASILVVGAGTAFMLAGALRLGALSSLIARPVLRGYAFGLALVIAVKQWPLIAAVHVTASGFFSLLVELARDFPSWQGASLGCGLTALAGLFVLEREEPRERREPAAEARPLPRGKISRELDEQGEEAAGGHVHRGDQRPLLHRDHERQSEGVAAQHRPCDEARQGAKPQRPREHECRAGADHQDRGDRGAL